MNSNTTAATTTTTTTTITTVLDDDSVLVENEVTLITTTNCVSSTSTSTSTVVIDTTTKQQQIITPTSSSFITDDDNNTTSSNDNVDMLDDTFWQTHYYSNNNNNNNTNSDVEKTKTVENTIGTNSTSKVTAATRTTGTDAFDSSSSTGTDTTITAAPTATATSTTVNTESTYSSLTLMPVSLLSLSGCTNSSSSSSSSNNLDCYSHDMHNDNDMSTTKGNSNNDDNKNGLVVVSPIQQSPCHPSQQQQQQQQQQPPSSSTSLSSPLITKPLSNLISPNNSNKEQEQLPLEEQEQEHSSGSDMSDSIDSTVNITSIGGCTCSNIVEKEQNCQEVTVKLQDEYQTTTIGHHNNNNSNNNNRIEKSNIQQQQQQQHDFTYINNNNNSYHIDTDDELDDKALHGHRSIQQVLLNDDTSSSTTLVDDIMTAVIGSSTPTTTIEDEDTNLTFAITTTTTATTITTKLSELALHQQEEESNDKVVQTQLSTPTTESELQNSNMKEIVEDKDTNTNNNSNENYNTICTDKENCSDNNGIRNSSITNNNNIVTVSKLDCSDINNSTIIKSSLLSDKGLIPKSLPEEYNDTINNTIISETNEQPTTTDDDNTIQQHTSVVTTVQVSNIEKSSHIDVATVSNIEKSIDVDVATTCCTTTEPIDNNNNNNSSLTDNLDPTIANTTKTNTNKNTNTSIVTNIDIDSISTLEPCEPTNHCGDLLSIEDDTDDIDPLGLTVESNIPTTNTLNDNTDFHDISSSSSTEDDTLSQEEMDRQLRVIQAWQRRREACVRSYASPPDSEIKQQQMQQQQIKAYDEELEPTFFVPRVIRRCSTGGSSNKYIDVDNSWVENHTTNLDYKNYIVATEQQRIVWYNNDIEQMRNNILSFCTNDIYQQLQTLLLKIKSILVYIQNMKESIQIYSTSLESIVHDWYINPKDNSVYSTREQSIKKVIHERRYGSIVQQEKQKQKQHQEQKEEEKEQQQQHEQSSSNRTDLSIMRITNFLQPIVDSVQQMKQTLDCQHEKIDALLWYSQLLFQQTKTHINKVLLPSFQTIPDRIIKSYKQQKYDDQIQSSYKTLLQMLDNRIKNDTDNQNPIESINNLENSKGEHDKKDSNNTVPLKSTFVEIAESATVSDSNSKTSTSNTGYDSDLWCVEVQYRNTCRLAKWSWLYHRQYIEQCLFHEPLQKFIQQQQNQLHTIVLHYLGIEKNIFQSCSNSIQHPAVSTLHCNFCNVQTNNTIMKSIVEDTIQSIMTIQQQTMQNDIDDANNSPPIVKKTDDQQTKNIIKVSPRTTKKQALRQEKLISFKKSSSSMSSYLYLDDKNTKHTNTPSNSKKNNDDSSETKTATSKVTLTLGKQQHQLQEELNKNDDKYISHNTSLSSIVPELVPHDLGASGFVHQQYIFLVECRTGENGINDVHHQSDEPNQHDIDNTELVWKIALGVKTGDELLHIFPTSLEPNDFMNDGNNEYSTAIILPVVQKDLINSEHVYPNISVKLSDWTIGSTNNRMKPQSSSLSHQPNNNTETYYFPCTLERKIDDTTTTTTIAAMATNQKLKSSSVSSKSLQQQKHRKSTLANTKTKTIAAAATTTSAIYSTTAAATTSITATTATTATTAGTKLFIYKINIRFLFDSDRINFINTYKIY